MVIAGVGVVSFMFVLWLVHLRTVDAGIVDFGWAAGLGLTAVFYAFSSPETGARQWLLAFLAGLWSFRLAGYLLIDRVVGGEEDGRYQTLRGKWGAKAPAYFLGFFTFQALLVVIFSTPYLVVARNDAEGLTVFDLVGVLILAGSILGEFVSDGQLANFRSKSENRGRTCREGLWRYSRHPNYFFEWLHWWGYVFLSLGSPWWWLSLLGPVLMAIFIFKITGIPATEEQALASRGEDYRRYQENTSAFIPWFPRKTDK
jgi:steroid 5-alpha reductase family enzyme